MILNTPISQDHHAPKARASDGLDSVQSGLSARDQAHFGLAASPG